MDTYPLENSQENSKKINKKDKPFGKDKFVFDHKKNTYICPMDQILEKQKSYKNNSRIAYWTKNCKTCQKHQECCGNRFGRIITDYENPNKIKMLKKNGNTMGTRNLQKTIKNSRMAIWKYKTKSKSNRIQHNRTKKKTQTEAKSLAISHN